MLKKTLLQSQGALQFEAGASGAEPRGSVLLMLVAWGRRGSVNVLCIFSLTRFAVLRTMPPAFQHHAIKPGL